MGTSKSYAGPTGQNPLIPPWADISSPETVPDGAESNEDGSIPTESQPLIEIGPAPTVSVPLTPWSDVKANFTRYAKSTYSSAVKFRKVARSFTKAQGGIKNTVSNAARGRSAVQNIGGIFSGLAEQGDKFTYNGFSFRDCVGKKTSELLETFVNLIVETNGDLESMIARTAAVETFKKVFDELGVEEKGFEALEKMDLDNIPFVFQTYLSEYITANILQKVGQILEKIPETDALQKERWMKNYIETKVKIDLGKIDTSKVDWKGSEGKRIVDDIFAEAYKLIETI